MTRDDLSTLLPFLANDTLTGEERTEAEAAVAADTDLRAELAALKAIRTTMQAEETFSPGEMGLARLMRDVDQTDEPVRTASTRPMIWQIAAAFLLAVVLGQAYLMNQGGSDTSYELAGTGGLQITLQSTATEADIRNLLLDAGVEIVAGPSAIGLYDLRVLEDMTEDQAIDILQASSLVESLSTSEE